MILVLITRRRLAAILSHVSKIPRRRLSCSTPRNDRGPDKWQVGHDDRRADLAKRPVGRTFRAIVCVLAPRVRCMYARALIEQSSSYSPPEL